MAIHVFTFLLGSLRVARIMAFMLPLGKYCQAFRRVERRNLVRISVDLGWSLVNCGRVQTLFREIQGFQPLSDVRDRIDNAMTPSPCPSRSAPSLDRFPLCLTNAKECAVQSKFTTLWPLANFDCA